MRHAQLVLLFALLAFGTCACGSKDSPVAAGTSVVSDGRYSNAYFGLTLSIPDGWAVASKDSEEFMSEVGESVLSDDSVTLKAAVEASKKTTFQLLTLSEFEMGSPVEFNPSLILMAERVSHAPGIKSGKDYLFHINKILMQTQLPYELVEAAHPVQLGNREWYQSVFVINQPQMPIDQSYFAVKQEDFVLVVILSAATEAQMDTLERIADSIAL